MGPAFFCFSELFIEEWERKMKASRILSILGAFMLSGCVIGRLDTDKLRIIPLSEVGRMDVTPWHPHSATLNEIIDRTNKPK